MNSKTPESTQFRELLLENDWLAALDDSDLDALLESASRRTYQAGETVLQQGAESDGILVVVAGNVRLIDEKKGEKPIILATQGRGTSIGERAFVADEPIFATVKAAEDLEVLCLTRDSLKRLLSQQPEFRKRLEYHVKREAEFHFLRTLNLLSGLRWRDTEKLLDAIETVTLGPGDFLFHEGDQPDGAYIIRDGEVEVIKESAGNTPVAELKAGSLLGEIALHSGGARNAAARAKTVCTLLRLKKADYQWITTDRPIRDAIARISRQRMLQDDFLAYRSDSQEGRLAVLGLLYESGGIDRFWQLAEQDKQSPERTLQILAQATGFDYLVPTPNLLLDPELVRQVPPHYLQANQVVPIFVDDDDRVEVLVGTPFLGTLPVELATLLNNPVSLRLTEPKFLAKLIESSTAGQGGLSGSLSDFDDDNGLEKLDSIEDLKDQAQAAPIIKLVNNYFMDAISRKASDIHIDPYEEGIEVRYRIDGILHLVATAPRRFQPAIVSRIKIMSNLDIAERRIPQDGRISLRLEARSYDIRVATVPTVFGEGVVMRILDKSSIQVAVDEIGFSAEMLATWRSVVAKPNGVVLVTGPTGSGKTTTLYATLNHIKSPKLKLITAEDPVEYQLHGIEQIQINAKVDMTFAAALRSMLRLDPDIIMVGEIRDFETAEIAVQAALTGHLVFSTLHTNDAPTAITRLVEMGIAPYLIASSLNAALAQRLVRRLCPACRVQSADGRWHAAGCARCDRTGYKGRLGIYELMVLNDPVRELIVQNKDAAVIGAEARRQGMVTLWDDGEAKVAEGLTSEEELRRVAG